MEETDHFAEAKRALEEIRKMKYVKNKNEWQSYDSVMEDDLPLDEGHKLLIKMFMNMSDEQICEEIIKDKQIAAFWEKYKDYITKSKSVAGDRKRIVERVNRALDKLTDEEKKLLGLDEVDPNDVAIAEVPDPVLPSTRRSNRNLNEVLRLSDLVEMGYSKDNEL